MTAAWERDALRYAARRWPVLLLEPRGKEPLSDRKACPNGVHSATTDPDRIKSWAWRFPDSNIGIATGAPGPTVLDVDKPDAAPLNLSAPYVATARGAHFYYAGRPDGTVVVGFGELRGRGSYVVAPPSIHATGQIYEWRCEPNGALPELPAFLVPAAGSGNGSGEQKVRGGRVPHGERHDHLVDFATRLARAGVVDERKVLAYLRFEFEQFCEPDPPADPRDLYGIARWAVRTRIAQCERERDER